MASQAMHSKQASEMQTDLEKTANGDDDLTNHIVSSFAWHDIHLAPTKRATDQPSRKILDGVGGDATAGMMLALISILRRPDLVQVS